MDTSKRTFKSFQDKQNHAKDLVDKSYKTDKIPTGGNSKFWMLPTGEVYNLNGNWHYQHIIANIKKLKKFGMKESELPKNLNETETRIYALNVGGLIRMNYSVNGGMFTVECPAKSWGREVKHALFDFIANNIRQIDQLTIVVLDTSMRPIKRGSFNWNIVGGPEQKMDDLANILEKVISIDADELV